jgi:hypothetical protein
MRFCESALARNMGFAIGKAILVYMYVLNVLYRSGVADVRRQDGVVIGGRLVGDGWFALSGMPRYLCTHQDFHRPLPDRVLKASDVLLRWRDDRPGDHADDFDIGNCKVAPWPERDLHLEDLAAWLPGKRAHPRCGASMTRCAGRGSQVWFGLGRKWVCFAPHELQSII